MNEDDVDPTGFNPELNDVNIDIIQQMKDVDAPLYDGASNKTLKLSFIIRLYHIKCMHNINEKAMLILIELLHDTFEFAKIPSSGYAAKKIIKSLGLGYTKIHACENDCMLYWGDDIDQEVCRVDGDSRYKNSGNVEFVDEKKKKTRKHDILLFSFYSKIEKIVLV